MLFTGDLPQTQEKYLLNKNIASTILKVAHHGSKTSSTKEFISAVEPQYAVIGVGKDNKFGHPAPETLEKLQAIGTRVLRTDQAGNIKVVFDGSNCTWYSYRYQGNYF